MEAISDSLMSPAFRQGVIDNSFQTSDNKNVKFLKSTVIHQTVIFKGLVSKQ